MDMQKLAEEIIEGKRLTRKDDLSFFLECDTGVLERKLRHMKKK